MAWLRSVLTVGLALLFVLAGLWLVVANDQMVTLNLMVVSWGPVLLGQVVLFSLGVGVLIGLLVGLNLLTILKLRTKLYWLRREVQSLEGRERRLPTR